MVLGTTIILSNGTGHFGPTDGVDQLQSWSRIFQLDQTEMVHSILMYQLKFLEFWVEWKVPSASC